MANPEIGETAPVVSRTEFVEVPRSISDVASSADENQVATDLVRDGEVLVEVSKNDPVSQHFNSNQIQQMKKGPIEKARSWLGRMRERRNKMKLAKEVT